MIPWEKEEAKSLMKKEIIPAKNVAKHSQKEVRFQDTNMNIQVRQCIAVYNKVSCPSIIYIPAFYSFK